MIKLAFISPISYLRAFSLLGDIEFALAHIALKSKEYREYFYQVAHLGRFVILDNGAFEEGDPVTQENLLELVTEMRPSEIIAPDKLHRAKETIDLTLAFLDSLPEHFPSKVQAVAQGETFEAFKECYYMWLCDPRVHTIGVPFHLDYWQLSESPTKNMYLNRTKAIEILNECFSPGKPHHCLGMSDPIELSILKKFSFIRSCDSTSAFVHGARGIRYTEEGLPGEKLSSKLDFNFSEALSIKQQKDIRYNIGKLKEFVVQ